MTMVLLNLLFLTVMSLMESSLLDLHCWLPPSFAYHKVGDSFASLLCDRLCNDDMLPRMFETSNLLAPGPIH
jgi:hypothetical protein